MKNLETIIASVCEKRITDTCAAIFHNGSSAVGLETEKSDIDLVFIVDDVSSRDIILENISKAFPLYKKIYTTENHNGIYECEAYMVMGVKVDISFFLKTEFLAYTETFYDSIKNYRKHVSRIKHKVIDAKPVYDPLNILTKAVSWVKNYPPIFKEELIEMLRNKLAIRGQINMHKYAKYN